MEAKQMNIVGTMPINGKYYPVAIETPKCDDHELAHRILYHSGQLVEVYLDAAADSKTSIDKLIADFYKYCEDHYLKDLRFGLGGWCDIYLHELPNSSCKLQITHFSIPMNTDALILYVGIVLFSSKNEVLLYCPVTFGHSISDDLQQVAAFHDLFEDIVLEFNETRVKQVSGPAYAEELYRIIRKC